MGKNKHPFAILGNNYRSDPDGEKWRLISRYSTMDGAMDALRDYASRPKKHRIYRYIILPIGKITGNHVLLNKEIREQVILKSR